MTLRVGVDLGGTKIEVVLLRGEREVLLRRRVATPKDYQGTLEAVVGLVRRIDAEWDAKPTVGVGSPGAWVASRRRMKNCNSTWLNGRPLLDDLNRALDDRVRLANDANCFALSEATAGAGRDMGVVFGVILGTGVGGGIVVERRILSGANAVAGEWGHTPLPYFRDDPATAAVEAGLTDRPCYCGRVNCVETFLSGPGLRETHRALGGVEDDAAAIPPDAPSARLYATMLARALAQMVNVLDPDIVVLGGGVSQLPSLVARAEAALPRYGFSLEGRTRIVRAEHGDASGVFGACDLWPLASDA